MSKYISDETIDEKLLDKEISNLLTGIGFSDSEVGTLFYKEVIKVATRYLNDLYKENRLVDALDDLKGMVSNLNSQLYQCAYNAGCGILIYSKMLEKNIDSNLSVKSISDFEKVNSGNSVMSMHDAIKRAIPSERTKVNQDNYWFMVYVFANYIFNKINLSVEETIVR